MIEPRLLCPERTMPRCFSLLPCLLLAGCVGALSGRYIITTAVDGTVEEIPATVSKPDGPGPFPAVVIVHDCSGLGLYSSGAPGRWALELVQRGYVVILPDSFSSRGYPNGVCMVPVSQRAHVNFRRRARDAYAALAYVRTLPYVDARRVGILGGSHGGSTTLESMRAPANEGEPLAREKRAGFAAAVALYPGCAAPRAGFAPYRPVAPLLILAGEKDDWTPAEPCQKLAQAARAAGYPMEIKVYPGVHHAFDSSSPVRYLPMRINLNSPTGRGATTGGDPQAWSDSIREVAAFFGRHL
jgi:dienelactone hydrolase